MGKEHGYMPERQHTPGEVDERRPEGSGATVTDGSARRTDSPRGDALFAPAVAPEPAETARPVSESGSNGAPATDTATPPDVEATTAMPASGAPAKPSPTPRSVSATDTAAPAEAPTATAPPATAPPATAPPATAPPAADEPATTPPATTPPATTPPATTPPATAPPAADEPVAPQAREGDESPAAADAPTTSVSPAPPAPPEPAEPGASGAEDATTAAEAPTADESAPSGEAAGATGTPALGTATTEAPVGDEPTVVHDAGAWSAEDTQVIPRAAAAQAAAPDQPTDRLGGPADPPTEQIPVTRGAVPPVPPQRPADPSGSEGGKRGRRRPLLIVAGVVALLAVLYVADLVLSTGNVPRGVTVAGMQLGGLSKAAATERLRAEIEPRATRPVQVTAGEVQSQIDPRTAGLVVDYRATVDQAGEQPLNPITRITSFFTEREVGVVNTADERSVLTALEQVKPVVDKPPVEGTVKFEGTTPVAVPPVPGQQLDLQAAADVLERDWAAGAPVALPLIPQPTITTDEDVQQALRSVATPAVSAPVTIQGEGATATLAPADIATALTFRADAAANPTLVPEVNNEALKEVATPQLASSEKPGRDASLDFSSGAPVVVPSQDGRGVDYDKTFQGLVPVLTAPGPRTLTAVYADQPAKLTTEQLGALGITGEISTFTTGGFAADSGRNIKRAAEQVNGTIVGPGETFSLNALTNPRNAANGYVEAGIIENGHSARGIGGGVSQVATTLYNAAYFAGMVDVEHKEHSFYISRYPAAREATVFDDIIDLKFRNDGPTGVLIQTFWTPSSLTVKMFGTKRYEVTSEPGPRTNPTDPQTINLPAGPGCTASKGAPGFTATDTRVMRNIETGEVTRKTRTVRYNPSPIVVCG
ncbi:VanW family protein [Pseudonocardia xishanensis]|uniref:VanW family protein n=1 Tax=Pseudonocardia xishanensis TaxID=630995 RepID=UPI0031E7990D